MLANRLNLLLAERGLSIKEVHEKTKLSRTTISNLVNNIGGGVQSATLNQLCMFLKITPGDFFDYCPFDLSFTLEDAEIEGVNQPMEDLLDLQGFEKQIRVTIDTGSDASLYELFRAEYHYGQPAVFDEREYKQHFDIFVYVTPRGGDKDPEVPGTWFKSHYFDKMSVPFQKSFFSKVARTALNGIVSFQQPINDVIDKAREKNATSVPTFIALPYGETQTINFQIGSGTK